MDASHKSWPFCVVCQVQGEEELVENPLKFVTVLDAIRDRARYGETKYVERWAALKDFSVEELKEKEATWHRKCYQEATHSGMIKRAREKYEQELEGTPTNKKIKTQECSSLTRSQTAPYNKDVCFFCDKAAGYRDTLRTVRTESAGKSLHEAIKISGNEKLRVKLSTAVDPYDAHAIDIKYHMKCWGNNVSTVLRQSLSSETPASSTTSETAAKIEFLTTTEIALKAGKVLIMSDLEAAHNSILEENGVDDRACSRKALKQLIKNEIEGVEFHKPKRVNEAERVTVKETRDTAMQKVEERNVQEDMSTLYDAALLLRKSINKCKKWVFDGSLETLAKDDFPDELYCFFRWVINGPNATLTTENKCQEVHKRTLTLVQNTMSMCLTERQVGNKKSEVIMSTREMPLQLAIGLAVHQAVRSKELVSLLRGFGLSVEYNRLLRVESQLESSVLQRMERSNGLYLPPDIVNGRHVFFAIDNVDFAEDTYDGRNTLHGTSMAIYQKALEGDEKVQISLRPDKRDHARSANDLPPSISTLMDCPKPPSNLPCPKFPTFGLFTEEEIPITLRSDDYAWLLARSLSRENYPMTDEEGELCQSKVPVWSAYNSLVNEALPITRVGSPPLVAAPAHEWNTLLTVLKQAQAINVQVIGRERKTVISLDMGLYMPAKKLQMARGDLSNLILRCGELHIVMAQLKTIGAYIESSGIDMAWMESDLYGSSTVRQIIEGNHIKRAETAHLITLQALFNLYQQVFLEQETGETKERLTQLASQLEEACTSGESGNVAQAHKNMVDAVGTLNIMTKMSEFDEKHASNPMFKVFRRYMEMVLELMMFIRAVRTADWDLHLKALEIFTKSFFAHDRLNYARMIPLYLAEMKSLETSDPDIYSEFKDGNWIVNKNPVVPFCGLGADNALEHINRSMKVSGGLVGITLNPNARAKFFLIAPELAQLAEQARDMAGASSKVLSHHHKLTTATLSREEKSVNKLTATITSYTNPFDQSGDDLFNLVTKVVVSEETKRDLCAQSSEGAKLLNTFVSERIQKGDVSLWSPMKKRKLLTWKTTLKKTTVSVKNKVVELQEDRSLFARMMVVCQSRPEINIQEAIGKYEFSVVPRSLFAADGVMLHCLNKSTLMSLVEKEAPPVSSTDEARLPVHRKKAVIVDGMAELQALDKPAYIATCAQLAEHFTDKLLFKFSESEEIHLVFDRYDVPSSLKSATRVHRQGDQAPIYYRISDTTHIAKVPMKRLLSHTKTKMKLTEYLAAKVLQRAEREGKDLVVAWGCECKATHRDVTHLRSSQEEADTKIMLHAIDSTRQGATEIHIFSPDTDVFILCLRRCPELCSNINFVTGTGQRRRVIKLQPIAQALGHQKVAALPGLHALSGADVTGCFAGKGKATWWKVFLESDEEVFDALANMGSPNQPTVHMLNTLERLVCKVYAPKSSIANVKELRWSLFRKKQAQSEKLPPTHAALHEGIKRACYQEKVWSTDCVANPQLPSPEEYGWKLEGDTWVPVMTSLPPAPDAVIELVKCNCLASRCSTNRCTCRKANLNCTDLCGCSGDSDLCENHLEDEYIDDYESDSTSEVDDDCSL